MSKKYYNQNYKNSNSSYSNNASTSNMKNKKTGGVSPIWKRVTMKTIILKYTIAFL